MLNGITTGRLVRECLRLKSKLERETIGEDAANMEGMIDASLDAIESENNETVEVALASIERSPY